MLRPQPDAGAVGEPKTASFRLLLRHLQSLPFPDPFNPAVADRPAGLAQQGGHLAVAVAKSAEAVSVRRPLLHVGNVMLMLELSEEIRGCLRHAEECARKAEETSRPSLREFSGNEGRWFLLAHSYQFVKKLKDFRKAVSDRGVLD
jgi:hypothetical protein